MSTFLEPAGAPAPLDAPPRMDHLDWLEAVLDVQTLSPVKTICDIHMNDIGRVVLSLQKPII